MVNKCYQYDICYASSILGMLQQTEELSRHTIHQYPNLTSKIEKIHKKGSTAFFQTSIHNNFQQANVIQLEFFTQVLCREYCSKMKN